MHPPVFFLCFCLSVSQQMSFRSSCMSCLLPGQLAHTWSSGTINSHEIYRIGSRVSGQNAQLTGRLKPFVPAPPARMKGSVPGPPAPRAGERCQGSAVSFLNILAAPLVRLSEFDMFHLEAEIYKNINSLKSDTAGNLGEHISTSKWIMIMQIIGELYFVF